MAKTKRRYRRYRKGTWSTRINNIAVSSTVAANSTYMQSTKLCENPAQTDSTVSQKFTVKNIDVQLQTEFNSNTANLDLENFQWFILFIPQGFTVTSDTPYQHPEWIMAHRFIGLPLSDASTSYPPIHIRSRLARNLDTGDSIILLVLGRNTNTNTPYTVDYKGVIKYNTKAN